MADKKRLFREYFKCFFFRRYDCQKNDLSEDVLKQLQPRLSENETAFIQDFKTVTRQVYDLLAEDEKREGTPEDKYVLTSYERIADHGEIPVQARMAMYQIILDTRDKYKLDYRNYLCILQKKISLMKNKDLSDLKLACIQIHTHSDGVDKNIVHSLIKEVYKKNPENPLIHTDDAAALAKEVQADKRNERYKFYQDTVADIDRNLAGSLPDYKVAELLEKKYGIIGKTGIGRLKAAQQKAVLAEELQDLFKGMDNYGKEQYYRREEEIQKEQISLINQHLKKGKSR